MKTLSEVFNEEARKLEVWLKATRIEGYDPMEWRQDEVGSLIQFSAYGDRSSDVGWEIDHIVPLADGGPDILSNLRPLHWKANAGRNR